MVGAICAHSSGDSDNEPMDAAPQDFVGFASVGIGELGEREVRLHGASSQLRIHAAAVEDALGVEALLDARGQCGERRRLRLEHRHGAAQSIGGADERGVAASLRDRAAHGVGAAIL